MATAMACALNALGCPVGRYKLRSLMQEAQQDILDYIVMFYNRLHSYLDYLSPNECEAAMVEWKKVA